MFRVISRPEFPMLLFTTAFGAPLLMMGHHARSEAFFYYFRLEAQVPENHRLCLIDRRVHFEVIEPSWEDCYSFELCSADACSSPSLFNEVGATSPLDA
jgi:hypothetical protein